MTLAELEGLTDFALLGPGFSSRGGDDFTLLTELKPGAGPHTLWFAPYEARGSDARPFCGTPVATRVEFPAAPRGVTSALDERGFLTGVAAIREAIAAGDVYQVNLTQRALVRCEKASTLFAALCRRGLPRFAAWVKVDGVGELVSASPELLFSVRGSRVQAEPMKGTAGPGQRAWLEKSEKDRAELAMITDLLRDDLQHVCLPRSVTVPCAQRFLELPYVVQAVSDVEGTLRDGVSVREILTQLHPGGSVTGAPRPAACAMIRQLEAEPRGAYCGSLGLARDGEATFALLIRTAERTGADTWRYGVGSGITWDSDAPAELEEVRLKLGAL